MDVSSPLPRRGRPPRVDLTAILDAAERVGLHQITATAVAKELGVAEGTIRHHADNADRLYALASARVLDRLDPAVPGAVTWRTYLSVLCRRMGDLVSAHPGIESYLVYGPYTDTTMDLFDRITTEVRARDPELGLEAAWLVSSRAAILTVTSLAVRSTRYPPGTEPEQRRQELFRWMLDAYLTGAEVLVSQGRLPQLEPTSHQAWARLTDDRS